MSVTVTGNQIGAFPAFRVPGLAEYNGVQFGIATQVMASSQPVYTTSGMQVKYVAYQFRIQGVLVPTSSGQETTDVDFAEMRNRLSVEGRLLKFSNLGFGPDMNVFSSGVSSGRPDVLYGPKPQILEWTPLAAGKSCRFTWICEVHLPPCSIIQTLQSSRAILEFEWSSTWDFDDEGLTTRTVTGQLEVASQRTVIAGGNRGLVQRTADQYRDLVTVTFPVPLPGFVRRQTFNLSDDFRILKFSLVDTELGSPEAYSPGIVKQDIDYTISNSQEKNLYLWTFNLSGSVTVSPSHPKDLAWAVLNTHFDRRLEHLRQFRKVHSHEGTAYQAIRESIRTGGCHMIPLSMSFSEKVTGRTMTFDVTWMYTVPLEYLLQAAGFLMVTNRQQDLIRWNLWRDSMILPFDTPGAPHLPGKGAPFGSHGAAQLKDVSPKVLVNICSMDDNASQEFVSPGDLLNRPNPQKPRKPDPPVNYDGYLDYRLGIETEEESNKARRKILQSPNTSQEKIDEQSGAEAALETFLNQTGGAALTHPSSYYQSTPVKVQQRTSKTYTLAMRGYSVRVGQSSPIPRIEKIADADVEVMNRRVLVQSVARNVDTLIYLTAWDITYALSQPPKGDLANPANIAIIGDGFRAGLA